MLVIQLIIMLVLAAIFTLFRSFIFNTAGERVVARLRIKLFRAIVHQELALFDKRKTGELLSRLNSDTVSLQDTATSNVSMFIRGLAELTISAVLMFHISWRLTLLVFGVVPVVVITIRLYGRQVRKLATKYTDALGDSLDTAHEAISNIRTLRSFAGETLELFKYSRAIGDPDDPSVGGKINR